MDYKRYDFELKLVLIREYWFVILRLLDDYLLNLWSSGSIQIYIPYTLIIILFARWKYYICNKCYEIIYDKMYIDHYSNRIIRNNLVSFDIFQGDRFWFRRDFKRYCFLRVQIYINILLILSYPISVNFFPQLLGSFENPFLSTV